MSEQLSWALVVATYNRPEMLAACIAQALEQDPLPAQVVVVDASDDWEASRRAMSALAQEAGVDYVHRPASVKSLTCQRNEGIELATSDVVFLIDDDSLMHPGCAATIMAVYEKDTEALVAGVQAALSPDLPSGVDLAEGRKVTGRAGFTGGPVQARRSRADRVRRFLWRELFLMDGTRLFVPYDGFFHAGPVPAALADQQVQVVPLFHGCRMTFRRSVVTAEPFEPLLRSYCPGEDMDASYRASRHGLLLTATTARLHHYEIAGARVNRTTTITLALANQSMMIHRNAADVAGRWREFRRLYRRRIVAELLKDLLSRRWDVPQLRGVLRAYPITRHISRLSEQDRTREYPEIQARILARRR